MSRAYIAGPMTGLHEFNFPAFAEAARELRMRGYEVVSPHEMDEAAGFDPKAPAEDFDLRDALTRDIEAVLSCDLVVTLPGWRESPGAMIEVVTASAVGIPVQEYALAS